MSPRKKPPDRPAVARDPDHLVVECVTPELDGGRYPVKRVVGATIQVGADIFKEGQGALAARLLYRGPGEVAWTYAPLTYEFDSDRWLGSFVVNRIGLWTYTVEGWTDVFETWRAGLRKKVDDGQDVRLELREGAAIVKAAARRASFGPVRAALQQASRSLEEHRAPTLTVQIENALNDELAALMMENHPPHHLTRYDHDLHVRVDRERAVFAAWYEMFPRSQNPAGAHGTFDHAAQRLPQLAELGWDVVYLPPIHPIGRTFRKGRNNSLTPGPDDVGSPWAIGNENGGHLAIEPALGTVADFDRFVRSAAAVGMEVAIDYALQCSPDHPWVTEHPDWFHIRPDGTIQYAENPPKKYQDIYPLDFWCEDRENLWEACREILLFWIERGVKIFRVDNPHTKPFAFWEWVITEVQHDHPDVVFFAEAFTRPKRMKSLAKLGFTMSYTYFTWKNAAWEIEPYLEELTQPPMVEYFRGNLFANTPDILSAYLAAGGPAAFRIRLVLAATLLPLYGIYSGFELFECVPLRPDSEEYLDSEKFQIKTRDWEATPNLHAEIALLNRIRRENPALQRYANLSFHRSDNPAVLFYQKSGAVPTILDHGAKPVPDLFIIVNLEPRRVQETMVHVPIADLGIGENEPYTMHDLLTDARYTWRGVRNYVRLDPVFQVAHVLKLERPARSGRSALTRNQPLPSRTPSR